MKKTKKIIGYSARNIVFAFALALALAFTACQTYQAGGTMEPIAYDDSAGNSAGVFFAGDFTEYSEFSLIYFPQVGLNSIENASWQGAGIDTVFKYPFHFAGNHFSIFPMLGIDGRFLSFTEDSQGKMSGSIGAKIGAGFDINFTKAFFLRGKAMYTPEFLSFIDPSPGFRFNVGLGYRMTDDDVRSGFKSFKTLRIDGAIKKAKESFEKKNYDAAVVNYRKAIDFGAELGNTDIVDLSAALYERAKQNRDRGDLRESLDDLNASMRHQYFISRQKYEYWIELLNLYKEKYGQDAPYNDYGKLIFASNDLLTIDYDLATNGLTNPNETTGNGWNLNLPTGRRILSLSYNEPHYDRGNRISDSVRVVLDVEDGHIYRAEGRISDNQVTIIITDVTNSELGKNLNISAEPVFSRTVAISEERPKPQSVTITIVNNTGYTIKSGGLFPAGSNPKESELRILELGGNIRNGNSRKVTLPALDLSRRYSIILLDTDDDGYLRESITITSNMTITFTVRDYMDY
jgi:hypothetical protein